MQGHGQTTRQDGEEQSGGPDLESVGARAGAADCAEVYARDGGSRHGRRAGGMPWPGRRWRAWTGPLERWLLPSACLLCGAVQQDVVCAGCAADLLPASRRCARCAAPVADRGPGAGAVCPSCKLAPPPFDAALALGHYAPPQDSLALALKFGAALPLAHWFAVALAARWHATGLPDPDVIVPIPLGRRRLAERGFNQAWEIARRLGRQLGIPASPDLLSRARETAAQATLDSCARQRNVAGAFALASGSRVDGLHIGLVDDVMTTGATMADAVRVLKKHGAARVSAIVALRTP
jgi:ComF family protein